MRTDKYQPHRKHWKRYEKPKPGHRLQMDVKFLERIPGTAKRLYQFTAIEIRVLKVYDKCNQRSAIQFLNEVRQRLPFRIHVVQTDNVLHREVKSATDNRSPGAAFLHSAMITSLLQAFLPPVKGVLSPIVNTGSA